MLIECSGDEDEPTRGDHRTAQIDGARPHAWHGAQGNFPLQARGGEVERRERPPRWWIARHAGGVGQQVAHHSVGRAALGADLAVGMRVARRPDAVAGDEGDDHPEPVGRRDQHGAPLVHGHAGPVHAADVAGEEDGAAQRRRGEHPIIA